MIAPTSSTAGSRSAAILEFEEHGQAAAVEFRVRSRFRGGIGCRKQVSGPRERLDGCLALSLLQAPSEFDKAELHGSLIAARSDLDEILQLRLEAGNRKIGVYDAGDLGDMLEIVAVVVGCRLKEAATSL